MSSSLQKVIDTLASDKSAKRVVIAVFCIMLALFSFGKVSYNDFFWHLALGKWMVVEQSFLTTDIFSLAFHGKTWLNNTWIFDGIVYLLFTYTDAWGLNLLRLLVYSGTFFILYKIIRLKSTIALPIILAAFIASFPLIRNFLRPEITSPLFTCWYLYVLFKYQSQGSKLLYLLPVTTILWVNTHGGFTLAIILPALFFFGELIRELIKQRNNVLLIVRSPKLATYLIVTILSAAATLLNPYGISIYTLLQAILSDRESLINIGEWQPLSWTSFLSLSFSYKLAFIIFGWAALVTLVTNSLRSIYRQGLTAALDALPIEEAGLYMVLLLSTLEYVRGMHLFTLIAIVITLRWLNLRGIFERFGSYSRSFAPLVLFTGAILFMLTLQRGALSLNVLPSMAKTVPESIAFVIDAKFEGAILNEYASGSELAWLLYPHYRLFIDGRTPNVYDQSYFWMTRNIANEQLFDEIVEKYDLRIAILQPGLKFSAILEKKGWKLAFFDDAYAIYVSSKEIERFPDLKEYTVLRPTLGMAEIKEICSNSERSTTMREETMRNMAEVETPLLTYALYARFALQCGSTDDIKQAETFIQYVARLQPGNAEHLFHLGSLQLKLNRNHDAYQSFKRSIALSKNKQNMTGLGIALHNLGNYRKALKTFKAAHYAVGEFPPEYFQIYGRTLYQLDMNAEAIDMFTRYQSIVPDGSITKDDYLDLSRAFADNGNHAKAIEFARKAEALSSTE